MAASENNSGTTTTLSQPADIRSRVDDLVQINAILADYVHLLDEARIEEIVDIFWEDCSLRLMHQDGATLYGHDGLRDYYLPHEESTRARLWWTRHKLAPPAIRITHDSATARSYFDADALDRETGKPIAVAGRYDDTLAKRGGLWKLTSRTITVGYTFAMDVAEPQIMDRALREPLSSP